MPASTKRCKASVKESKLPGGGQGGPGARSRALVTPSSRQSKLRAPATARSRSPARFKAGDRVAISGVKQGIIRYFGKVHFTEGDWCGIELIEAEGKHDGLVDGKRYFTCAVQHGIFAPVAKVALTTRPTNTAKDTPVAAGKTPVAVGKPKPRGIPQPAGRSRSSSPASSISSDDATVKSKQSLKRKSLVPFKSKISQLAKPSSDKTGVKDHVSQSPPKKACGGKKNQARLNTTFDANVTYDKNNTFNTTSVCKQDQTFDVDCAQNLTQDLGAAHNRANATYSCEDDESQANHNGTFNKPQNKPNLARINLNSTFRKSKLNSTFQKSHRKGSAFSDKGSNCDVQLPDISTNFQSGNEGVFDYIMAEKSSNNLSNPMTTSQISHASSLGILSDFQLDDNNLLTTVDELPKSDASSCATSKGQGQLSEQLKGVIGGKESRRPRRKVVAPVSMDGFDEREIDREISGIVTPEIDISSRSSTGKEDGCSSPELDPMRDVHKNEADLTFDVDKEYASTPDTPIKTSSEPNLNEATTRPKLHGRFVRTQSPLVKTTSMDRNANRVCRSSGNLSSEEEYPKRMRTSDGFDDGDEEDVLSASFELAKTAVAQYADLVQGAEKERALSQCRINNRRSERLLLGSLDARSSSFDLGDLKGGCGNGNVKRHSSYHEEFNVPRQSSSFSALHMHTSCDTATLQRALNNNAAMTKPTTPLHDRLLHRHNSIDFAQPTSSDWHTHTIKANAATLSDDNIQHTTTHADYHAKDRRLSTSSFQSDTNCIIAAPANHNTTTRLLHEPADIAFTFVADELTNDTIEVEGRDLGEIMSEGVKPHSSDHVNGRDTKPVDNIPNSPYDNLTSMDNNSHKLQHQQRERPLSLISSTSTDVGLGFEVVQEDIINSSDKGPLLKDRPISMVSTASADTGIYSEHGGSHDEGAIGSAAGVNGAPLSGKSPDFINDMDTTREDKSNVSSTEGDESKVTQKDKTINQGEMDTTEVKLDIFESSVSDVTATQHIPDESEFEQRADPLEEDDLTTTSKGQGQSTDQHATRDLSATSDGGECHQLGQPTQTAVGDHVNEDMESADSFTEQEDSARPEVNAEATEIETDFNQEVPRIDSPQPPDDAVPPAKDIGGPSTDETCDTGHMNINQEAIHLESESEDLLPLENQEHVETDKPELCTRVGENGQSYHLVQNFQTNGSDFIVVSAAPPPELERDLVEDIDMLDTSQEEFKPQYNEQVNNMEEQCVNGNVEQNQMDTESENLASIETTGTNMVDIPENVDNFETESDIVKEIAIDHETESASEECIEQPAKLDTVAEKPSSVPKKVTKDSAKKAASISADKSSKLKRPSLLARSNIAKSTTDSPSTTKTSRTSTPSQFKRPANPALSKTSSTPTGTSKLSQSADSKITKRKTDPSGNPVPSKKAAGSNGLSGGGKKQATAKSDLNVTTTTTLKRSPSATKSRLMNPSTRKTSVDEAKSASTGKSNMRGRLSLPAGSALKKPGVDSIGESSKLVPKSTGLRKPTAGTTSALLKPKPSTGNPSRSKLLTSTPKPGGGPIRNIPAPDVSVLSSSHDSTSSTGYRPLSGGTAGKPGHRTTQSLKGRSRAASIGSESQISVASATSTTSQVSALSSQGSVATRKRKSLAGISTSASVDATTTRRTSLLQRKASDVSEPKKPGLSMGSSRLAAKLKSSSTTAAPSPRKPANQNKNKTLGANSPRPTLTKSGKRPTLAEQHAEEISRLEALCESRTKELNYVKLQLRQSAAGFEAMSVLVNYTTHGLDAFACPEVKRQLQETKARLENTHVQLCELMTQRDALIEEIKCLKDRQASEIERMQDEHSTSVRSVEERLAKEKQEEVTKLKEQHCQEISSLKSGHEKSMEDMAHAHDSLVKKKEKEHEEALKQQKVESQAHIADLQQQHEHALHDITKRFDNIKMTLSEKVDHLRAESEAMRRREREYLASYKADSDSKVRLAIEPLKHLPQEIESLKAVMEMKNQEIHDLRRKNAALEKQLEELPKAKDKITNLVQKAENLEAVIKIKADNEKQLSEKHSVLLRRYDREAKVNKRLSMDKDQLEWRLSQDLSQADLLNRSISHSPPSSATSTPEPMRRKKSPLPQHSPRSPRGGIAMEFFEPKSPRTPRSSPFDSPRTNGTNSLHRQKIHSADFDRPVFTNRHSSADLYANKRESNNVFEPDVTLSQDDSIMSVSTQSEPTKDNVPMVKTNLKRSGTYDLLNEEFELCEEAPSLKQTDV